MRAKKIIALLIMFILSICFFSYSNEKALNPNNRHSALSFVYPQDNNLNSNIQHYKLSSSQRVKLGLAMGITGSVMTGVGICLIIPGSVLMGVSWAQYYAPYSVERRPPADPGYHMWFGGIGLLVGGIILFALGVPLAIIGFILYFNGGKFSTLIESDKDSTRLGFVIKL